MLWLRRTIFAARVLAAVLTVVAADVASAAMLSVGDTFPTWTLQDQTGKDVSSSDLAGKTYLIWFFPKAMTPGCTAEGRGLRDQYEGFKKKGVEVFGVSFDEPAANAAFVAAEAFPFRLLSDRKHTLALAVGAADSPEQPVARRISYVVGPDGKVLKVYESVTPAEHAGQVLKDI